MLVLLVQNGLVAQETGEPTKDAVPELSERLSGLAPLLGTWKLEKVVASGEPAAKYVFSVGTNGHFLDQKLYFSDASGGEVQLGHFVWQADEKESFFVVHVFDQWGEYSTGNAALKTVDGKLVATIIWGRPDLPVVASTEFKFINDDSFSERASMATDYPLGGVWRKQK
jgi:hypothetical protein